MTKPLEHDCTHHRFGVMSLAGEQLCHDVDVASEMRFFGIDAKVTRDGIMICGAVLE